MLRYVPTREFPLAVLLILICLHAQVQAQIPLPSPTPLQGTVTRPAPLALDEVLRLANAQASTYQSAILNERVASEDVRQATAAFKPKISAPLGYLYTSPAQGLPPGEPRAPSFVTADGIGVYSALINVSGDFDISGRLRATLAKNRALLAAAHAATEVARLALAQAVIEAYYDLALAISQSEAAQGNLASAEEFERITSLLLSGGEVAAVDLTRAELQTLTRRDELQKARSNEEVAAAGLRVFIGYDFNKPINTVDLGLSVPAESEYLRFRSEEVSRRPEFSQLEQQLRAAREEIRIARADRLPSLAYSFNGGFETDSVKSPRLKEHSGLSAGISFSIPIFDWGASKSRQRQAQLRAEITATDRLVALRGFSQQFFAAQAQAASAVSRIALARSGVTRAQENLIASIARYRAGEAQIVEVTDAQTTLVAQRSALNQAIFDYQLALAHLRLATGNL